VGSGVARRTTVGAIVGRAVGRGAAAARTTGVAVNVGLGRAASGRLKVRAAKTAKAMMASGTSQTHAEPPLERRAGAARPRGGTLAEYRFGHPAEPPRKCYKRFTFHTLTIPTNRHRDFVDVTNQVQSVVAKSQISDGICLVFSPHTTAGVTINENADPDVVSDLLRAFDDLLGDEDRFRHAEGNSGGHALTSLIGPSVALPIQSGRLELGQWQAIYLCEFDGPRQRTLQIQVVADGGAAS
jgi:secondary thiamine-phosphate synthase enzyme